MTAAPVHSAFLAQGAVSLWSYCSDIPHAKGNPGYFRGDVAFAETELPKDGALGAFGARGPGVEAVDLKILDWNQPYDFERGKLYNIESSQYIAEMQGFGSGAHNDIAHPQVAHAMWSAVLL